MKKELTVIQERVMKDTGKDESKKEAFWASE